MPYMYVNISSELGTLWAKVESPVSNDSVGGPELNAALRYTISIRRIQNSLSPKLELCLFCPTKDSSSCRTPENPAISWKAAESGQRRNYCTRTGVEPKNLPRPVI